MIFIPDRIKEAVGAEGYVENNVGMSESTVLIYPGHVLKIQKHTAETDNENNMVSWVGGQIPVPEISVYLVEKDNTAYTLMTKAKGRMLCDDEYLNDSEKLIRLVAEGLKMLWSIDVSECPYKISRLEERLKQARYNVELELVDMENVEPETFGENGFSGPVELLAWLEENRPQEDIVLTHGDFCLPNIFADNGRISGFIDLGKMGPADRWQDIAIALRSLEDNLSGQYNGGKPYAEFEPHMLLDELGIEMDEEKNRYYRLLDELF